MGLVLTSWPYILCIGAFLLLLLVVRDWPAVAEEPALLRWLRCCSDHPIRTLAAVLLVACATRPDGTAT